MLVVLAGDSVDPTNPKVVRASAGSLFHLPVVRADSLADAVAAVREAGLTIVAADVSGDVELGGAGAPDLTAPTAWVFGNEAWGLTAEELSLADAVVRIPIFGQAESLNLARLRRCACTPRRWRWPASREWVHLVTTPGVKRLPPPKMGSCAGQR